MPPLIDDAPWWANLLLLMIAIIASASVPVFASWMSTKKDIRDTKDRIQKTNDKVAKIDSQVSTTHTSVEKIDSQVSNTHTTNLREDLDEHWKKLGQVLNVLDDVRRTVNDLKKSINNSELAQSKALNAAIRDRDYELDKLRREIRYGIRPDDDDDEETPLRPKRRS